MTMEAPGSSSQRLLGLVEALPSRQRQSLVQEAQTYITALDRAIAAVLAPTVGRADDRYLVADDLVPLYGVGVTAREAMADYRSVVVEYYEDLEASAAELTNPLREQLDLLRRIFTAIEKGR